MKTSTYFNRLAMVFNRYEDNSEVSELIERRLRGNNSLAVTSALFANLTKKEFDLVNCENPEKLDDPWSAVAE